MGASRDRTSAMVPYLFLDVDGVLNAFAYDPGYVGFDDFDVHEVGVEQDDGGRRTFEMVLSGAMGRRLAALRAEIIWTTTWEHHADRLIAPLCGLPSGLRVLARPPGVHRGWGQWKFDELRRAVGEEPRPFVWIDDDIDRFESGALGARQWADGLNVPSLLIAPDPRSGLHPGALEAIEAFVERVTADGSPAGH